MPFNTSIANDCCRLTTARSSMNCGKPRCDLADPIGRSCILVKRMLLPTTYPRIRGDCNTGKRIVKKKDTATTRWTLATVSPGKVGAMWNFHANSRLLARMPRLRVFLRNLESALSVRSYSAMLFFSVELFQTFDSLAFPAKMRRYLLKRDNGERPLSASEGSEKNCRQKTGQWRKI